MTKLLFLGMNEIENEFHNITDNDNTFCYKTHSITHSKVYSFNTTTTTVNKRWRNQVLTLTLVMRLANGKQVG